MFLYAYILVLFAIPSVTVAVWWDAKVRDLADLAFGCFMGGFFAFVVSIPLLLSYSAAAHNWGTIQAQQPIIAHYELHVAELNEQLDGINPQSILTMNHDTPIASLVSAKQRAQEKLLEARTAVDEARLELTRSSHGLLGGVVHWVTDGEHVVEPENDKG